MKMLYYRLLGITMLQHLNARKTYRPTKTDISRIIIKIDQLK